MTTKVTMIHQKQDRFLSALKFAVVGASADPAKNGSKALKFLLAQHKEVVPVNPSASEIQGIKCLKTLSELPDPTHTSVSVVVRPEVTLEVLKLAKLLNVYALWLQPGAEDDAVINFIQADTQLEERCLYRSHAPVVAAVAAVDFAAAPTLEQQKKLFLSASHFAVVGASTNDTKNGSKALEWLVKQKKDVIPINLNAPEIQSIKCKKSLSELADPTHTGVVIVVPPKVTLEVLKLVKSLDVYAVWIQPGAEDDAVVEFIEADAQLKARCVYRQHALHTTTASPMMMLAATAPLHPDVTGPCIFAEPTVVESTTTGPTTTEPTVTEPTVPATASPMMMLAATAPLHPDVTGPCIFAEPTVVEPTTTGPTTTKPTVTEPTVPAAAPLAASNVIAGVKHALSPPSTPPVTKSLKLSPDTDLGEEIPGLA